MSHHEQQFSVVPRASPPAVISEEDWVLVKSSVARHEVVLLDHAKDIDQLKHGRTAVLAIVGFVTFVCGVASAALAFMAMKQ